jgi:2-oxoglutarate dehydrogenase E1 component
MEKFTQLNNSTPAYVDDLYQHYKDNPELVDDSWKHFFEGYDFAVNGEVKTTGLTDKEVNVIKLIHGYRSRGHLIADTNPIRKRRDHKSDLELNYFDLDEKDLNKEFESGTDIKLGKASLNKILEHLKKTYCGPIGAEFMYCKNEKLRQWLYDEMESCGNRPDVSTEDALRMLHKLGNAVNFENFLQTKFVGKKRFSLEGLEVLIPALDQLLDTASGLGVDEFVLGMAHRGRLNVLVNVFEKSYEDVFSEFEENVLNDFLSTGGDVKYHLGRSADVITRNGKKVHLSLVPNPSHLETVGPVLQGMAYAKAERYNNDTERIVPIVIHGDAAISGQGVNYETANFSKLDGYDNGGTIHIVTNNQVGFTTNYKESRSSVYCTDLAKVTESPVFHVNADDPIAVVHAIQMAVKIRQKFKQDVYVDILGYRKYGHNEGDEPRFTQPLLYKVIGEHKNVYELFLEKLVAIQAITKQNADDYAMAFKAQLQEQLDKARAKAVERESDMFKAQWKGFRLSKPTDFEQSIETGVNLKDLDAVAKALITVPESFNLFNKSKKLLEAREAQYFEEKSLDWGMAEMLAYGSLLQEGYKVRLSGQDSQRGTFSHRHAVIKDVKTEDLYVPLNNMSSSQKKLSVYNSSLSEYAVLAFDYGYSLANPNSLTIWEAQFGDFSNGAQIVIDQYISASESKWQRMSGLVMYLPHGYEGQGPEHSSARFERYLQLCAENNMYVCNVTSPANFFHLLRRQVHNDFRKPLVIMTPKSLLRHPKVKSPVSECITGRFQEVLDENNPVAKGVTKVLLCTGKVYYDLLEALPETNKHIAIIRLEQLYPCPKKQMEALRKKYSKATKWIWVQEEPQNMGAWGFMLMQYREWNLDVIARTASASPATGSNKIHNKTQIELVEKAINA